MCPCFTCGLIFEALDRVRKSTNTINYRHGAWIASLDQFLHYLLNRVGRRGNTLAISQWGKTNPGILVPGQDAQRRCSAPTKGPTRTLERRAFGSASSLRAWPSNRSPAQSEGAEVSALLRSRRAPTRGWPGRRSGAGQEQVGAAESLAGSRGDGITGAKNGAQRGRRRCHCRWWAWLANGRPRPALLLTGLSAAQASQAPARI